MTDTSRPHADNQEALPQIVQRTGAPADGMKICGDAANMLGLVNRPISKAICAGRPVTFEEKEEI